jgi:hypothetical protein
MPNKALSVASVIEKNKVSSGVAFVVLAKFEIFNSVTQQFVETIYVANNDEAISFQGNTYVPFVFSVDVKYEAGAVPTFTMTATDFQKVLMNRLQVYGGATGSRVTLIVANSGNLSQGPEVSEVFEIIGSSASEWTITFTLGAESVLTRLFPGRTQMRDRCSWRYKGAECGYTGAMATCDLSLQGANGCAAHNNTANFGGFPALQNRGVRYG